MQASDIEHIIQTGFAGATVSVEGGDGQHFHALVISDAFVGKSRVQQHRMVYQALGGRMESEQIHALALKTYTPEGWQKSQDRQ